MCFFGKNVKNIAIKGTNLVGLYRVPRGTLTFPGGNGIVKETYGEDVQKWKNIR